MDDRSAGDGSFDDESSYEYPESVREHSKAFFLACERGDLEACTQMVKDPETRLFQERPTRNLPQDRVWGSYGSLECSPLHAAAWNGHSQVVEFLLCRSEYGFIENIDEVMGETETALSLACSKSHWETCRVLLEAGANPNMGIHLEPMILSPGRPQNHTYGCAYLAVKRGNMEMLDLLLHYDADPECAWKRNFVEESYPLDIAIKDCNVLMLKELYAHGCFMLDQKWPALNEMSGSLENRARVYSVLEKQEGLWYFSLCFARCLASDPLPNDSLLLCSELLETGVDVDANRLNDSTGLLALLENEFKYQEGKEDKTISDNAKAICQLLINHGADPFSWGLFDRYFHIALEFHDPELKLLEWLLQRWKDRYRVDAGRSSEGDYPIHVACRHENTHYKSIDILVQDDAASLEAVDGALGLLPVQIACLHNVGIDVIYTLLRHKPDIVTTLARLASKLRGVFTMESTSIFTGRKLRWLKRKREELEP